MTSEASTVVAPDERAAAVAAEASTGNGIAGRPVAVSMSRPVLAVTVEVTLGRALELLATAGGVRHLVVVDVHGRCAGVLADRALCAEWARDPVGFEHRLVQEVIDTVAPVVLVTSTVGAAASAMQQHHTDAVAVVDDQRRVQGILTAGDLIALLAADPRGR
jgi:CBS domain-containing protein